MARGPLLFARVVRPIRSLWQRFAFVTLIGTSLSLMVADEVDIKVLKQIKTSTIYGVGTLLELGAETSAAARESFETLAELGKFKDELVRLRLENNELKKWKYKDIPKPVIKDTSKYAIVKIRLNGICSTDILRSMETGFYNYPIVPGHEMVGEVHEIKKNSSFKIILLLSLSI